MYWNYCALESKPLGKRVFGAVVLIWIVSTSISLLLPEFPGDIFALMFVDVVIISLVLDRTLRNSFATFEGLGGVYYSLWRCAGIALGISVLFLAFFFGLFRLWQAFS